MLVSLWVCVWNDARDWGHFSVRTPRRDETRRDFRVYILNSSFHDNVVVMAMAMAMTMAMTKVTAMSIPWQYIMYMVYIVNIVHMVYMVYMAYTVYIIYKVYWYIWYM